MDEEQPRQAEPAAVLLAEAGIPVPDSDMSTIENMHRIAGHAREMLRTLRLLETEPATTFAPRSAKTEDDDERR